MKKTITHEEVTVVIGTLTYGQRLERAALIRKFAPALGLDADDDAQEEAIARSNFAYAIMHIREVRGADLRLPSRADSQKEFDAAFQQFLALPDAVVQDIIVGVNELDMPNQDRASVPTEMLTEAEKKDPNS